ncbi:MAG: STAS domain-containing protein [Caldilineaceae bacterium]|nr:STAS domain-containing protein [Caldilineaceae bacterium]
MKHKTFNATIKSEEALAEAFASASSGVQAVTLNFGRLDYMNSSGIGLLVTRLIRAQRQKQKLLACGLSNHYQQIFQLTRLDETIGIFESESEAMGAV